VPAGEATELHFEPMNHPGHLVRRLHQICVAVFLDAAKDYNITHVQYATLKAIERFPGVDQTRVGKLVALDRQTTSNVVTRLQQNGLIERTRKDKRTYALHITGPGRALIEVMQPRIAEIDEVILGPLSPDERQTLMSLLQKLVNSNNELSRAPLEADVLPQVRAQATGEAVPQKTARAPGRKAAAPRAARAASGRA
jgi:DNA-binding MarR family transcriptional regulator